MTGETTRAPLTTWPMDAARAAAKAFREAYGRHHSMPPCYREAAAAFVAAGGDPESAGQDVVEIIAAVARDHPDWLYGPCRARLEREEAYWRGRGVWPPPLDRGEWPDGV